MPKKRSTEVIQAQRQKQRNKIKCALPTCFDLVSRGRLYCSNQCQADAAYEKYIEEWLSGQHQDQSQAPWYAKTPANIRKWVRAQKGDQCWTCGWCAINPTTGRVPIEIDHINGNSSDCSPNNLQLLCPNCHSLTPTYRALNKGKGRAARRGIQYFDAAGAAAEIAARESQEPIRFCDCGTALDKTQKHYCSTECYSNAAKKLDIPLEILSKELWETPATHLAVKYGVSNVAILKYAKRYRLPVPGRGYWNKQAALQRNDNNITSSIHNTKLSSNSTGQGNLF
jgi:5-methylcytosine-specific restriction endonuclease McrA